MTPSRILIVEDEAIVAMDLKLHLQELGYGAVDLAGSGEEAIQVWNDHADEIDLLFADMRMSGMTGMELYEQLKIKKSSLRVIISSGYSAVLRGSKLPTGPSIAYLAKPYQITTLAATMRECLDHA